MEEFYAKVGGDYEEVFRRLRSRERILKFIRKVPEDASFHDLKEAVSKGDTKGALSAAHALKSVCLNLGLNGITKAGQALTEYLCIGGGAETAHLFEKVEEAYNCTISAIKELEKSDTIA